MSVEGAIRTRLLAHAPFSALTTRVYHHRAPQKATLPYAVMHRVTTERHSAMGVDRENVAMRLQVSCHAAKPEAARGLADAARAAVRRYSGTLDGTYVEDVYCVDETSASDYDTQHFMQIVDFLVWYRE